VGTTPAEEKTPCGVASTSLRTPSRSVTVRLSERWKSNHPSMRIVSGALRLVFRLMISWPGIDSTTTV